MRKFALLLVSLGLLAAGCNKNQTPSGNTNVHPNANKNAEASKPSKPDPILTKEPDRYTETVTIDVQPPGTPQDNHIPPLQFGFVRFGADRRADFNIPPVGPMTYLEHSGLRYLVLPKKEQYVELDPRELDAQLPRLSLLTPTSVVDHIKSHSRYENLGVEKINDRNAVKYRFDGQGQTSTFFLDETTGLPVRAEILSSAEASGARVMMEMRDVKLNPDASLFDIPIGYKKVPALQMKEHVSALTDTLKTITDALAEQMGTPSPSPQPSLAASPEGSPTPSSVTMKKPRKSKR